MSKVDGTPNASTSAAETSAANVDDSQTAKLEPAHDHQAAAEARPNMSISSEMGAAGLRALVEGELEQIETEPKGKVSPYVSSAPSYGVRTSSAPPPERPMSVIGETVAETTDRNRQYLSQLTVHTAGKRSDDFWEIDPEHVAEELRDASHISDFQADVLEALITRSGHGGDDKPDVLTHVFHPTDPGLNHDKAFSKIVGHHDLQYQQVRVLSAIISGELHGEGLRDNKVFQAVLDTPNIPVHVADQLIALAGDREAKTGMFMTLLDMIPKAEPKAVGTPNASPESPAQETSAAQETMTVDTAESVDDFGIGGPTGPAEGGYELPMGGALHVMTNGEVLYEADPDAPSDPLTNAGFTYAGETGYLSLPTKEGLAHLKPGDYDLPDGSQLWVMEVWDNQVMFQPNDYNEESMLLNQGFRWAGETGAMSIPGGKNPTPGTFDLPGGASLMVKDSGEVLYQPNGDWHADSLDIQDFRSAGETGYRSLPKQHGPEHLEPGRFPIHGGGALHVTESGEVLLELPEGADPASLTDKGFAWAGDSGYLRLPSQAKG
jgi:hypothetical protein